jgi:hypothetical protein
VKPLLAALLAAVAAAPLALWQLDPPADAARPGIRGFTAVSLSTCGEWARADDRARLRLVSEMGDHFGHASHVWGGARLQTPEALAVLQRGCADRRFRAVRLYKVYARALAWSGLAARR